NYYPFGLQHKGYNNTITGREHNYKYNGTELTEDLGYNMYEMPLRAYDPAIARWNRIDPVVHHGLSPYNAFDNNPVFYADPSGGNSWGNNHGLAEGGWGASGGNHYGGSDFWAGVQSDWLTSFSGGYSYGTNLQGALGSLGFRPDSNSTEPCCGGKKGRTVTMMTEDLVSYGTDEDNSGEFDERTPDFIRNGDFDFVSDTPGTLEDYNARWGTNYTNDNLGGQYYYNTLYRPQREELHAGIYAAQAEAAEYVSIILPMGPAAAVGAVKGAITLGRLGKFLKQSKFIFRGITTKVTNKLGQRTFAIGFRNKVTQHAFTLERHGFNTKFGSTISTTHINYGFRGKRHYFLNVFKRNKTADFAKDYIFKRGFMKF
ncbi:RHS repeat-associated core domain-containing protein, partial [Aquimarina sp. M1]